MLIVNFNKNQYKIHTSYSVKVTVSKRAMHKTLNPFLKKRVCLTLQPFKRNACYTGNTVKQASENTKKLNPTIPGQNNQYHKTVITIECPKANCKDSICPKPCEHPTKEKVVGHFKSTAYLPQEELTEKKIKKVADNNYKSENKPQFVATYKTTYEPSPNEFKQHQDSTDFLKNNLKNPKDVNHDSEN